MLYDLCYVGGTSPLAWRLACFVAAYKGKGDRLDIDNRRLICLLSNLGKGYEHVLVQRARRVSAPGAWQASESWAGVVDGRHQIQVAVDLFAAVPSALAVALDLRKAFPSASKPLMAWCAARRGLRGRLLKALTALHTGTSAQFRLADGTLTRLLKVTRGAFEGRISSPMAFGWVVDSLMPVLRRWRMPDGSELGVTVGAVRLFALLFVDDIVLLARSVDVANEMLRAVAAWTWNVRLALHPDKTGVFGPLHGGASVACVWWPVMDAAGATIDAARAHAGGECFAKDVRTLGVIYLGFALLNHVAKAIAVGFASAARVGAEFETRRHLTLAQALWAWTVYGRCLVEYSAAVFPPLSPTEAGEFEAGQTAALRGLLGPSLHPAVAAAMLLVLFDLARLDERRDAARARFALALRWARKLPERDELAAEFERRAAVDVAFDAASVTGELPRALARLELPAEPPLDGRARGLPGGDDAASDDEAPPGAAAKRRRAAGRWARAVAERTQARKRRRVDETLRPEGEGGLKSAALWREMRPSGPWIRHVLLDRAAEHDAAAYAALLIGAWVHAPIVHFHEAPAQCAGCGARGADRDLHLHFHCQRRSVRAVRRRWLMAALEILEQGGASEALAEAQGRGERAQLALLLGGRGREGGVELGESVRQRLAYLWMSEWGLWRPDA